MNTIILLGIAIMLVGFLWLLAVAFQKSAGWGIACLLISPVAVLFTLLNWDRAWKPFLIWIVGSVMIFTGLGSTMHEPEKLQRITAAQEEIQRRLESGEMTKQEAQAETQKIVEALASNQEYRAEFMERGQFQKQSEQTQSAGSGPGDRLLQQIRTEETQSAPTPAAGQPDKTATAEPPAAYRPLSKAEMDNKVADAIQQERRARAKKYTETKTRRKVLTAVNPADAEKYLGREVIIVTKTGIERKGILVDVTRDGLMIENQRSGGGFSYTMAKKDLKTLEIETWVEQ